MGLKHRENRRLQLIHISSIRLVKCMAEPYNFDAVLKLVRTNSRFKNYEPKAILYLATNDGKPTEEHKHE